MGMWTGVELEIVTLELNDPRLDLFTIPHTMIEKLEAEEERKETTMQYIPRKM